MFTIVGNILFGFGAGLGSRVLFDYFIKKQFKEYHKDMLTLSIAMVLLGEGLRAIERSKQKQNVLTI